MDNEIIMFDSAEAAHRQEGLSGWVSRDGHFYGEEERLARYAGCTHVACDGCGHPVAKGWLKCRECREKQDAENYENMPAKPYSGEPVWSESHEKFFFDETELDEFCEEEQLERNELRLVHCKPAYAHAIDPHDLYCDEIPEDGDLPSEVVSAFDALNEALAGCRTPISWGPDKVRVTFDTLAEVATHE